MRITRAQLLSPDRADVVLTHAQVARALFEPLAFAETYPEVPSLTARIDGAQRAAWSLGRVLRLEYDDGTAEAWRVRRSAQSFTSADSGTVELAPLWMDLGSRTIVAEIEGTSIATPRLSLISRSPASALAVAFDPLSGAPAVASGAPMFTVGTVDARYADERVDVSIVGGSPLDVVEAVAADLRCLWRARLVLSGDGPADEVYEVDLYAPSEPPDVPTQAFEAADALSKVDPGGMAEVGNAPGMERPNALLLSLDDDVAGLVTALVPLAASQGEDAVGVGGHVFGIRPPTVYLEGNRVEVTLGDRLGAAAFPVVPFDGALDGLVAVKLGDDPAAAWVVAESVAPDRVVLVTTGEDDFGPIAGSIRFMRPGHTPEAPRRALVELVNTPAAEVYGVLSEARTYDDVAPYPNEFVNGRCDIAEATSGASYPLGFYPLGVGYSVPFEWTDAEASVSVGERSAQFTASAEGQGVAVSAGPPPYADASRARAAWLSMRVVSGRVNVTMLHDGQPIPDMNPASVTVDAGTAGTGPDATGGLVLTTAEFTAADVGPGTTTVQFRAVGGPAVFVVDALTVVQSTTPLPYQTLMGPNALWVRAWDDLVMAPRRVTTATTTVFDPEALGLPAEDLSPGAWVRVRPDGRDPVELQVLEARWELDLSSEGVPGGVAAERQMRLGPPPYDLVSRLSSSPSRAKAPEGSKRAPVYPVLIDRGEVDGGRLVEASPGATITAGTTTRSFRGRTYELGTRAVGPDLVRTLAVRRVAGRDDAAILKLTDP